MPAQPAILYLGRDDLAGTLTFAIGPDRWEYWLHRPDLDAIEYIARRWQGKALAQAKRRAYRTERQL